MRIRVATFNVENLFSRPVAMTHSDWSKGQAVLADYAQFNAIVTKETYSDVDKANLIDIMNRNGITSARAKSTYLEFRDIRGDLAEYADKKVVAIIANGRSDWLGWLDLKRKEVDDEAITNTAQVIADVNPDVLLMVEAEDRPTLTRFYRQTVWPLLEAKQASLHEHVMLVDGNDDRGIDLGLFSRFPLIGMRSNVHHRSANGKSPLFSRDCIEFYVDIGQPNFLALLGNHFASKGSDVSGQRRKAQSTKVGQLVDDLKQRTPLIAVAGDLNDFPAGGSLNALLGRDDLVDVMSLDVYTAKNDRPGTFKTASANQKLDYILLSPALQQHVVDVGVFRKGYWSTLWEPYPIFDGLTKKGRERVQASDHHCLWVDLEF